MGTNCVVGVPLRLVPRQNSAFQKCSGPGCKGFHLCRDVAISYILPPIFYSNEGKIDFVSKILKTYISYHNNFAALGDKYQKSALVIQHKPDWEIERFTGDVGYNMPKVVLFNQGEYEEILKEMKNKRAVMLLGVHGTRTTVGMDIYGKSQTSLEEYADFARENGAPALFIESNACENIFLSAGDANGEVHCCWPQIFMESGVWAYFSFSMSGNIWASEPAPNLRKDMTDEKTIGAAIRRSSLPAHVIVFGDILAHMK